MTASYRILINKLDEFIRKYYKNQLVRGVLYALSLGLSFYISLVILEYYGEFGIPLRTVLFYSFAGGILFILVKFIVIPLFKLYRIGDVISYEEAAQIIGKHFSEVQDKLLNVLQLNKQMTGDLVRVQNFESLQALLEAGIEQKIREIKPVSFPVAIDISRNRKFIPYVAVPLLVILLAWFIVPSLLKQGTKQMFQYNTLFPKVAPFEFVIENNNLQAIQQKDFTLKLKIKGDQLPQDVYIQYEGSTFKMEKGSNVAFAYTFRNLQHNETFTFNAAGYDSKEYTLIALPEPQLVGFDIKLHYPAYLSKKDESLHNTGDLSIPQGTVVQWYFNTNNTDKLQLKFNDSSNALNPSAKDAYSYSRRFMQSENYSISASNKYFTNYDSVKYVIQVIPDLYPSIQVEQKQDSASAKRLYFNGSIKDDYGFTRLAFIYRIYNSDDSARGGEIHKMEMSISKNIVQQPFYFYWDMDTLQLAPGQQMEYYFEVWDNDGVNGAKSARTNPMQFKVPNQEEIVKNTEDNNKSIQNEISKELQQAYTVQSQMEQERADLFNKQDMNWADKKKIENLLQQQMELQKKTEEIAKKNKENTNKQWDYQKKDSDLMAKQDALQKLFDKLANDSIKKKLEELQKMLDKMNKDQIQEQLEKLTADNQDFKKELERTLELFKRLDFEQQLKENEQRLDSLAQKQEQLSKDSKNKTASSDELQKKQDQLNKEFEKASKDLENLEKKNNELEEPTAFKNPKEESQAIQQEQQKSSQELSKNNSGKASQSQHNASNGMKKMAEELGSMAMSMEAQSEQVDEATLRTILNNLVNLSFAQEDLMNRVTSSGQNNMQYADIAHKQKQLQDNAASIGDSLYALSKKSMKIQGIVNQEMGKINHNMEEAVNQLEKRQAPQAASRQQYAMTSINNLALMLSNVLASMQEAPSKNHSPGTGSCNKPGGMGSKPSMAQLRKMQEQLSKQLDAMKNSMKGGKSPGQKQGGKQGGQQNGNSESEQLAKMAAEQQYIREQMQQADDMMNNNKQGSGELGNIAQEMKKNEEDIVNGQITDATLQRQQQIITHLLEYEKAKQTKGQSPEFESHVAKKQFFGNPNPFLEYNSQKNKQEELLKTVPPDLNSFYRDKVTQYFNSFQ